MAILVKEAVDQGVTEFSISGDIQSLGFGTANCVFRDEILGASGQIKLDFTNAEGWPVDENGYAQVPDEAFKSVQAIKENVLYLTSPDEIEIDNVPFGFQSRETVLHLNINKEDEVESEPYLPYKIWRTLRFKDIIFEE